MTLTKSQQKQLKSQFSNKCYHRIFDIYQTTGGLYMFNLFDRIFIDKNIDPQYYTLVTVNESDSWTGLSYQNFSTTDYWWLIYLLNNDKTQNALELPKSGTKIRIPTLQFISVIEHAITDEVR